MTKPDARPALTSQKASSDKPEPLQRALRGLADEARRQLALHPWGHLLGARREPLSLRLDLPLNGREEDLQRAAAEASRAVAEAVQEAVTFRALVRPGRIYCLRCGTADCEHAEPVDPREVFIGYGPTGIPRFRDFGQWLLELKEPRVDELYGKKPVLLTRVTTGEDLSAALLPVYRDKDTGFTLHGQVTAGWFKLADETGDRHPSALTFQVVSTRGGRGPRRYGLNVLGKGPGGESLDALFQRLGRPPWADAVAWAREALDTLEQVRKRPRGKGRGRKTVAHRVEGILGGLARRLEKGRRAKNRKTRHAQTRHAESDRPTDMAQADARRARPDQLYFDPRHETLVVLGDRGRTHVFNQEGKHVTSVRYSPTALDKRKRKGPWRPASAEERAVLEKHFGTGEV